MISVAQPYLIVAAIRAKAPTVATAGATLLSSDPVSVPEPEVSDISEEPEPESPDGFDRPAPVVMAPEA